MYQLLIALTTLLPARLQPFAKAVYPFIGTLAAIAAQWIATKTFDATELMTTIVGLGATIITYLVPNAQAAEGDQA